MYSKKDRFIAFLVLSPSIILLAIFVYFFIGRTFQFSLTDWGVNQREKPPLKEDIERDYIGNDNYENLMTSVIEFRFRDSLVNTFFFTIFFLLGCLLLGFLLAFLVDQKVKGEGVFRTIFLFPMSLSFVVTGTIWRWMFNPKGGVNILPQKLTGWLPESLQIDNLNNQWLASEKLRWGFGWDQASVFLYLGIALFGFALFHHFVRSRNRSTLYIMLAALGLWLFYVGGYWDKIWLPAPNDTFERGFNAALTGIIIAAVWQMAGYVMALYLAGIRGIPDELREAARVDGCAEWQVYMYIILPGLRPITLSAVIILGHISLKIFDLVYVMTDIEKRETIVPGTLLFTKAFRENRLAAGSAIAVIMLMLVSVVIIPYLWSSLRTEERR